MRSVDDDRDRVRQLVEKFQLREWQGEALAAWLGKSRQGVIEAVTGAGKTRLGVAAIDMALNQGYKALVIVPTIELMNQWTTELSKWFGSATIARLGGGYREWFDKRQRVVIGVAQSVAKRNDEENRLYGDRAEDRLLVADEVHRYAAESWSKALTPNYSMRLGLTATYERTDFRHEEVLDEYFGKVIYQLWYDRALKDKIIADFDIAMVSVDLTIGERGRYDKAQDEYAEARAGLSLYVHFDGPRHKVDRRIEQLASLDDDSPENRLAKKYQRTSRERQRLAASASGKLEVLRAISDAYASSKRTLIFTMTQEAAREAAIAAATEKSPARAVYSDLDKDERAHALRAFKDGSVSSLAAPRILDEGVDVPEADLGIILAMNRSQRQFVQRLGRIIRLKKDGRRAQLVVVYAQRTVEDPNVVDDGDKHLRLVLPFAWRFGRFTFDNQKRELIEFLDLARQKNQARDNPYKKEPAPPDSADIVAAAISAGAIPIDAQVHCFAGADGSNPGRLQGRLRRDGRVIQNGNQVESLESAAGMALGQEIDWVTALSMWKLDDGTSLVDVVVKASRRDPFAESNSPASNTVAEMAEVPPQPPAAEVTMDLGALFRKVLRMEFIDPGDRLEAIDSRGSVLAVGEVKPLGKIQRDNSETGITLQEFMTEAFGEYSSEYADQLRVVGGPSLAALAAVVAEEAERPDLPRPERFFRPAPSARKKTRKKSRGQRG